MKPDFSLFQEAGIKINQGVLTDEFFGTSITDVFAIGDIAEFLDLSVGRTRVVRTWQNAMSQGRAVAKIILGDRKPFDQLASYGMKVFELDVVFIGDTSREDADEIVVNGTSRETGRTQLFLRKNRLVGATLVGRNQDRAPVIERMRSKQVFSDNKEKMRYTVDTLEFK